MEDYYEDEPSPETLLAEYDTTFSEISDGYLCEDGAFKSLIEGLIALFEQAVEPTFENSYIQEIWVHAKASYSPEFGEVDIKEDAYFRLLRDTIQSLGGNCSKNSDKEDESGLPGFTSAVWKFEADDPRECAENFHEWILEQLQ